MEWILNIIISAMPVIIGPTINVLILSKPKVKSIKKTPIDFGKNFIDHKRIFGNNKTWLGLGLSIILCAVFSMAWGIICKYIPSIGSRNLMYIKHENTILYNLFIGMLFGFTYSLFELPNSFLKRRCGIEPGKTSKIINKTRILFTILDQLDSEFGTMLIVWYFCNLTILEYIQAVILAGIIHYIIVKIMCYFKLKESV